MEKKREQDELERIILILERELMQPIRDQTRCFSKTTAAGSVHQTGPPWHDLRGGLGVKNQSSIDYEPVNRTFSPKLFFFGNERGVRHKHVCTQELTRGGQKNWTMSSSFVKTGFDVEMACSREVILSLLFLKRSCTLYVASSRVSFETRFDAEGACSHVRRFSHWLSSTFLCTCGVALAAWWV